jgi:guanylate kinase
LLRPLLAEDPRLRFSVSCTTRDPRQGEVDGQDYHFVTRENFERRIAVGEFVEWAEVHEQLYGTRAEAIEVTMSEGGIAVLDIDVQGGLAVLDRFGDRVVSVFVFPPSWEVLEQRLRGRGTNHEQDIATRLRNARDEVELASAYSYWIVNDNLQTAVEELSAVITAESLRPRRWPARPL